MAWSSGGAGLTSAEVARRVAVGDTLEDGHGRTVRAPPVDGAALEVIDRLRQRHTMRRCSEAEMCSVRSPDRRPASACSSGTPERQPAVSDWSWIPIDASQKRSCRSSLSSVSAPPLARRSERAPPPSSTRGAAPR
eukprot:429733-Prymnesium_polylepis.1